MPVERITVTLPAEVVQDIDRVVSNRSRFVLEAVRRELRRRRREDLRRSLRSPHPESRGLADAGLREWAERLPREDVGELVNPRAGRPIRWRPGQGWVEVRR